jgi:hypothetical protein
VTYKVAYTTFRKLVFGFGYSETVYWSVCRFALPPTGVFQLTGSPVPWQVVIVAGGRHTDRWPPIIRKRWLSVVPIGQYLIILNHERTVDSLCNIVCDRTSTVCCTIIQMKLCLLLKKLAICDTGHRWDDGVIYILSRWAWIGFIWRRIESGHVCFKNGCELLNSRSYGKFLGQISNNYFINNDVSWY